MIRIMSVNAGTAGASGNLVFNTGTSSVGASGTIAMFTGSPKMAVWVIFSSQSEEEI